MNKEFTRMQKLAGIITEGYVPGSNPDIDDTSATTALDMAGIPEGRKKMTKAEAKQAIKDAILAELNYEDPADSPYDEMTDPHNLPGGKFLDEATPDAMNRMDGLVSQNAKSMLLSAVGGMIQDLKADGFDEEDIHDYLVSLITTLDDSGLMEAKKGEEEEVEDVKIEDEEAVEEPAADEDMIDADMKGGMDMDAGSDEAKTAFDELTDAYRSAKELGDEKLIRQLANTITYFNKNIILK
jgi:hypothetical protein